MTWANAMVDGVSQADKDEEIPAQDESDNLELQEKKSVIDLNDQAAGDQVQFGDDQLIASAMENTLRADKDDPEEMTQQFDLNSLENTLEADKDDAMEMTQEFDLNSLKNTLRADNDDPEEMTQQFDLN